MINFEHKQILKQIKTIDVLPTETDKLTEWVKAKQHIEFLKENANSNEIVIYASGKFTYVHAIAVPEALVEKTTKEDMLKWHADPYSYCASYVSGGGKEGIWIEKGIQYTGSYGTPDEGTQLIYARSFDGWDGDERTYCEVNQEYTHLTGIHWRAEHKGYCKFDDNGDVMNAVSITRDTNDDNTSLVSFNWKDLEEYLAASNQVLIRFFGFTLLNHSNFSGWGSGEINLIEESDQLFYHQKIQGLAAYTNGMQIIYPRRNKLDIFKDAKDSWIGNKDKAHIEFTAYDWRNSRITKISTSPEATTNYFEAHNNDLPFELSPAFFRPEVMLKYKGDKDKYTIGERKISCRASWYLKGFDINEAGQVHAYIYDLAKLPHSELLHWLSYNEEPKASISRSAFITDFQGNFTDYIDPLRRIISKAREWDRRKVTWWKLKDAKYLTRVTTPFTSSRDEWGESFLELTKLIHEGFVATTIRETLNAKGIAFDKQDGSITLLEKLLVSRLEGLKTAQRIRTKIKGHLGGDDANILALEALQNHETFANHFNHVCRIINEELQVIDDALTTT